MKLSNYIKHLKMIEKIYGNIECYYAVDDEGNDYRPISYDPTVMCLDGGEVSDMEEFDPEKENNKLILCVN